MGGGDFNPEEDHVLVVCPWPKQEDVFSRISERYQGLKITFVHLGFGDNLAIGSQIPEGKASQKTCPSFNILIKSTSFGVIQSC